MCSAQSQVLPDTLHSVGDWLTAFFSTGARDLEFRCEPVRDGAHHPFKVLVRVHNAGLRRDYPFVRVEPHAFHTLHGKIQHSVRVVFTCCTWAEIRELATERSPIAIQDVGTHRTVDFHSDGRADHAFLTGRGCAMHLCDATHRYSEGGMLPYLARLTREMFGAKQPFVSNYREMAERDE